MTSAAISLGGGGASGVGSYAYFNSKVCEDADGFRLYAEQCSALFGPLGDWAAANPEPAAVVFALAGFGILQGGQMLVSKIAEILDNA
jgi:hypothetical protein